MHEPWKRLESTGITLRTVPTHTILTIEDALRLVQKKLTWIDPCIWELFSEEWHGDDHAICGALHTFNPVSISHKHIRKKGESIGVYKKYEIIPALLLVDEILTQDLIKDFCGGITIYLKTYRKENYRLSLYQFMGLRLNIMRAYPNAQLPIGRGVIFKKP